MFGPFSPPPSMKRVLASSGGLLTLVALGCLLVMSTGAHTSDIRQDRGDNSNFKPSTTQQVPNINDSDPTRAPSTARHRSGRLYQPNAASAGSALQTPLESYAAAYAAANSGQAGAVDQSALSHLGQQTVSSQSSAADANAYASFGEAAPAPPSVSSQARQLAAASVAAAAANDYSMPPPVAAAPAPAAGYFGAYMSPSEASYSHHQPHHHQQRDYQQHQQQYHSQYKSAQQSQANLPLGYPSNALYERYPFAGVGASSYYDRVAHSSAASSPFWSTSAGLGSSGGLMSSASHALSHWTNGISITEIVCGLVAIAIGAIILGAPFFLIYLALMGNFSGSGTLSLINPTSATGAAGGAAAPANGRRKRLAVFEAMDMGDQSATRHPELAALVDSVASSLSPYVDLQQVSRTFKQLVRSRERYSTSSQTGGQDAKRAKQKSS